MFTGQSRVPILPGQGPVSNVVARNQIAFKDLAEDNSPFDPASFAFQLSRQWH